MVGILNSSVAVVARVRILADISQVKFFEKVLFNISRFGLQSSKIIRWRSDGRLLLDNVLIVFDFVRGGFGLSLFAALLNVSRDTNVV